MRVREFAARAAVAPHVVRYYMRIGLLRPRRTANRYANFGESDLRRLAFVRRAQRLSFTLDEIRGLLAMYDAGQAPCPEVRIIGHRRRAEKAAELRELSKLHDRISKALGRWRRMPDGSPHDPDICPLIVTAET
jgi:DNA-binding transcriptional MerR regulator